MISPRIFACSQAVTSKRHDEQEKVNQLLKKFVSLDLFSIGLKFARCRDVDLALHKVSESEMQLRTMYRVEFE